MKKNIDEYAQQAMLLADEFIQFSLLKSVQNENTRKFKRCIIYVFISHGQCLKRFLQLFYITRILILGNLTHTILLISHIYFVSTQFTFYIKLASFIKRIFDNFFHIHFYKKQNVLTKR